MVNPSAFISFNIAFGVASENKKQPVDDNDAFLSVYMTSNKQITYCLHHQDGLHIPRISHGGP